MTCGEGERGVEGCASRLGMGGGVGLGDAGFVMMVGFCLMKLMIGSGACEGGWGALMGWGLVWGGSMGCGI